MQKIHVIILLLVLLGLEGGFALSLPYIEIEHVKREMMEQVANSANKETQQCWDQNHEMAHARQTDFEKCELKTEYEVKQDIFTRAMAAGALTADGVIPAPKTYKDLPQLQAALDKQYEEKQAKAKEDEIQAIKKGKLMITPDTSIVVKQNQSQYR